MSPNLGFVQDQSQVIDIEYPIFEALTSHRTTPGYNAMRGMGGALAAAKIERRLPQATRFGNHQDSLTRVSSSAVQMTPIDEVGDRRMGDNTQEVDPFVESNDFVMGCPMGSWDDSENYSSLKRGRGEDEKNSPGLNASDALVDTVRSLILIGFACTCSHMTKYPLFF